MIKGLEKALTIIDDEIKVVEQYHMPQMQMGMEQIKSVIQDVLDAEINKR